MTPSPRLQRTSLAAGLAAVLGALSASGFLFALSASAESFRIQPRYAAGDEYAVSLATTTRTRILARAEVARSVEEEVELSYVARVSVVEASADGASLRERHEGVELRVKRESGVQPLFQAGAAFDVVRDGTGAIEIFQNGRRIDAGVEKIVGHLLARQLEHGAAALVDPGREVELGESWTLDAARAESFLRAQGIEGAEVDGRATATLEGRPGERLVVRYRIPVERFVLGELPANARSARSKATLEGEVELAAEGIHRPIGHASDLAVRIKAATRAPGVPRAASWSVRRSESIVQQSQSITDQLAARS